MPRRSSRCKVSKGSSSPQSVAAPKASSSEQLLPSSLESYFGPNELKKQLADALQDTPSNESLKTSDSRSSKKKSKSRNTVNKVNLFKLQFGGGKDALQTIDKGPPKMVYADVVRNSILGKMDLRGLNSSATDDSSDSMATSKDSNSSNSTWTSDDGCDSLKRSCENSPGGFSVSETSTKEQSCSSDNKENSAETSELSNMLAKLTPETLQELDEATWEVVSIDDWSQCGSDLISEDQFQLLSDTEGPHQTADSDPEPRRHNTRDLSAKQNSSKNSSTSNNVNENNNKNNSKAILKHHNIEKKPPVLGDSNSSQAKKKKVIVTRKYIGGPDFADKMKQLEFEDKGKQEDGYQLYSGTYQSAKFSVEVSQRCGLLVVSVRAHTDSILQGLTCLQSLIEATGLCSYGSASLQSLMHRTPVPV